MLMSLVVVVLSWTCSPVDFDVSMAVTGVGSQHVLRSLCWVSGLASSVSSQNSTLHVIHPVQTAETQKLSAAENMFLSFSLDGWSDRAVRWVKARFWRC